MKRVTIYRDSQRLEAAMSLVWPMMILRAVLVSIVCILLAGCNDTSGFSITDFRATVDVAADGSAVVSEELTLLVKDGTNYGGVFFDVPLAFVDQAGWRRKRGFELLEAVHKGGDGYYTNRRTWDGRTIYVGHEHCRRCSADLRVGKNFFYLKYRLSRLVEERDGKKILKLPSYLSSLDGIKGLKSTIIRFPAEGRILQTGLQPSQYKVIKYSPDGFAISMKPDATGSQMTDLEVEFPANTFEFSPPIQDLVQWWLEDHLVKALSGAVLATALVYSGFVFRKLRGEKSIAFSDFDPDIVDRVSPGLAALIVHENRPGAMSPGFRGSMYWLAIRGFARISDASQVTTVFPTGLKASRKARRLIPQSTKAVLSRLNKYPKKLAPFELDSAFFNLLPIFTSDVQKENSQHGRLDPSARKQALYTFCILFVLSILSAYWGGYLFGFLASSLLLMLAVATAANANNPQPSEIEIRNFKDAIGVFVGLPVFVTICVVYLAHNIPWEGQAIAWILSYASLFVVGVGLWMLGRPSAMQKDLRRKISQMQRSLHQEPHTLAPAMSIDVYERFLPMAVALGEEKPWTDYFNDWLAASGTTYTPAWRCNADGGDMVSPGQQLGQV